MVDQPIDIEVVYAAVDRQVLLKLAVAAGTTLAAALQLPQVHEALPPLDWANLPVGIFGRVVGDPAGHVLQAGERIEIYRPLLADPMEIRRLRAAKAARDRQKG